MNASVMVCLLKLASVIGDTDCHPERSEGPLGPQERSLAALGMTAMLVAIGCVQSALS
jgi:hypothetical protein